MCVYVYILDGYYIMFIITFQNLIIINIYIHIT